eukprot:2341177-Rhodomonas_salina.1
MSHMVDGLPRVLHFPKLLRVPCAVCDEAKAKRQPYPDASTAIYENEDDLMQFEFLAQLLRKEQDFDSTRGNRRCSAGGCNF